jgi:acyl carrier protein
MSVLDRLKQLLERDFSIPAASLASGSTLESLDIDSLRLIEIVFAVEDEFKVTMPQDQGEIRDRVQTWATSPTSSKGSAAAGKAVG